jgi:peptidyl-prolyl cis-trans isomerase B (cyclophilin B)
MKRMVFTLALMGCVGLFAQTKPADSTTKMVETPKVTKSTFDNSKEQLVEITTNFGVMVAKLYNSTPLHRDNFIAKVKEGFYDSLLFHRVIREFMIQGGDPNSKHAPDSVQLGMGSALGPMIPAEFNANIIHKRGALAAARDGNPTKQSNNSQFYIVQGKRADTATLRRTEEQIQRESHNPKFHYTKAQKEIYERIGGTPQLDQNYTVFGEVISGLDVMDKITSIPTKPGDRPMMNIVMKMRLLN